MSRLKNKGLKLRPRAVDDLQNIYDYSYIEFGKDKASGYIQALNTAFENLAKNPDLGSAYSDVRISLKAYRVISHIVFYKISRDELIVIRILHKSMDYRRHIR